MDVYLVCHYTIVSELNWFMEAKTINDVLGFLQFEFEDNFVEFKDVIFLVFWRVRLLVFLWNWAFFIKWDVKFCRVSFDRRFWFEWDLSCTFGNSESFWSLKFEHLFIDPHMENKFSLLKRSKHDIFHNLELDHLLGKGIEHKNKIVIVRSVILGLEEMPICSE